MVIHKFNIDPVVLASCDCCAYRVVSGQQATPVTAVKQWSSQWLLSLSKYLSMASQLLSSPSGSWSPPQAQKYSDITHLFTLTLSNTSGDTNTASSSALGSFLFSFQSVTYHPAWKFTNALALNSVVVVVTTALADLITWITENEDCRGHSCTASSNAYWLLIISSFFFT